MPAFKQEQTSIVAAKQAGPGEEWLMLACLATRLGKTLPELGAREYEICPLTLLHAPHVGHVFTLLSSETLRTLPTFLDITYSNTITNCGVIPNGDAVVLEASRRFKDVIKSETGTLHWLAHQFLLATNSANYGLSFNRPWFHEAAKTRYPLETNLAGLVKLALEKTRTDGAYSKSGDMAAIASLHIHDAITPVRQFENKLSSLYRDTERRTGHVFGFRNAFNRIGDTRAATLFWRMDGDGMGLIKLDVIVADGSCLRGLMESYELYNGGEPIPVIKSNPEHLKGQYYDFELKKRVKRALRFPMDLPHSLVREHPKSPGSKGKVFAFSETKKGKWYELGDHTNVAEFAWDDLEKCARNSKVTGMELVEGGDGKAVINALRRVDKSGVDTKMKALNESCTVEAMEIHNSSVMEVSKALAAAGYLVVANPYSEGKFSVVMKVKTAEVGLTVVTLCKQYKPHLCFRFACSIQIQAKPRIYERVPYYASACIVASGTLDRNDLKLLGVAGVVQAPLQINIALPTDPPSWSGVPDGIGAIGLATMCEVSGDDVVALLRGQTYGGVSSALQTMYRNGLCLNAALPGKILACAAKFVEWRDHEMGKFPCRLNLPEPDWEQATILSIADAKKKSEKRKAKPSAGKKKKKHYQGRK